MTNTVRFVTLVLTNWVSFHGDVKRESGTNYVKQWMESVSTNTYREEVIPVVTYTTNRTVVHSSRELWQMTNAPVRWTPSGAPPLPPTPGQHSKE